MNIFERIQHGTGLENYCTDILVGILQKDVYLLRKFCTDKQVLYLPEEVVPNDGSLKISLQESFKATTDNKNRNQIDIKISGTNFLCFLEMKVESSQNKYQDDKSQLNHYHSSLKKELFENRYLRFCTKYYEIVSSKDIDEFEQSNKTGKYFHQLRWYNIHDFLRIYCQDNTLIKEFSQFLEMNMMDNKSISGNENLGAFLKIYEHFDSFEKILTDVLKSKEVFGTNSKFNFRNSANVNIKLKRFGISLPINNKKEYNKSWTNLFIGFEFREKGIYKLIWLWSRENENIKENFMIVDEEIALTDPNNGYRFEEALKDNEQKSDISAWFINGLKNITTNIQSI